MPRNVDGRAGAARVVQGQAREVAGKRARLFAGAASRRARGPYNDNDATLDDLREAVTTSEEIERIARRMLGGAHPLTAALERNLARAALAARETPS